LSLEPLLTAIAPDWLPEWVIVRRIRPLVSADGRGVGALATRRLRRQRHALLHEAGRVPGIDPPSDFLIRQYPE
jgi:hypothetical protein